MFATPELRCAWFAGFYEGEGHISTDRSNNNRLRLGISQNDPTPLELGKKHWGGSISKRTRKSPASDKMCTCYEWRLSHNDSLKFIDDIRPYMIIPRKIKQLEEAIARSKEGSDVEYACTFCDETFAYASNRRRHERTQHIERGTRFECDVEGCSRSYKTRDSLTRHQRLDHKPDASDEESSDEEILIITSKLRDTSLRESP